MWYHHLGDIVVAHALELREQHGHPLSFVERRERELDRRARHARETAARVNQTAETVESHIESRFEAFRRDFLDAYAPPAHG